MTFVTQSHCIAVTHWYCCEALSHSYVMVTEAFTAAACVVSEAVVMWP